MTCMTGSTFAYASAQAVCAVSVCSEASSHPNIAMILDASLLLASILICLLGKENSFISRITAHPTVSSLDLRRR